MTARVAGGPGSSGPARPAAVFLTGFMGCGKTTVGRALAARLEWPLVDLDEAIERMAGRAIAEIFERFGESGFRDLEHRALERQAARCRTSRPAVVALGGGTYAYARNRRLLRGVGPTVWLDAPAETLWQRVQGGSRRPLARDRDAFLRLHASRRASYAKADCQVDASQPPEGVLAGILGIRWLGGLTRGA